MPRNLSNNHIRSDFLVIALLLAAVLFIGTGCASVSLSEQAQLSRSGMLFSDVPTLSDSASVLATVEPGTDDRGGAAASGCTACK